MDINKPETWAFSTSHNCACKLLEEQALWGQTVCQAWLPAVDTVVRVPRSDLKPLKYSVNTEQEAARISYIASAAKVAELLEGGGNISDGPVLLVPMECNVIPNLSKLNLVADPDRNMLN